MQSWLDTVSATVDRLSIALDRSAAYFFLPLMSGLMLMEVIGRYVFNHPFIWSFEAVTHLLVLVLLLGLPECTRRGGHIRMDLLYIAMPDIMRRIAEILYGVIGIFVFALILKKAASDVGYLRSIPVVTEYLSLPIWMFYVGITVLSGLMVLMFVLRIVAAVRGRMPDETVDESHIADI